MSDMLENVKIMLGIENNEKDNILTLLIDNCKSRALAYCRREDMAKGMQTIIEAMTVRAYRVYDWGSEEEKQSVTGWKQGDRSEEYDDGSVKRDDWFNNFEKALEPFRIRKGKLPSEVI